MVSVDPSPEYDHGGVDSLVGLGKIDDDSGCGEINRVWDTHSTSRPAAHCVYRAKGERNPCNR